MIGLSSSKMTLRNGSGNHQLAMKLNVRSARDGKGNDRRAKLRRLTHWTSGGGAQRGSLRAQRLGHRGAMMNASSATADGNRRCCERRQRGSEEYTQRDEKNRVGNCPAHILGTISIHEYREKEAFLQL
jgi:hypothetical protein